MMLYRTMHTTSALVLMLSLLLHASWCLAEKKPEQPKQELSQLQKQLEALKKELDQAQEEHKDAADALKESEVAISGANKKLHEISKQQIDNKKELIQRDNLEGKIIVVLEKNKDKKDKGVISELLDDSDLEDTNLDTRAFLLSQTK